MSFSFLNISVRDPILVPAPSTWAARATQSQALISFSFLTIITSSWAARATQSQALISFLTISIRDPILLPA